MLNWSTMKFGFVDLNGLKSLIMSNLSLDSLPLIEGGRESIIMRFFPNLHIYVNWLCVGNYRCFPQFSLIFDAERFRYRVNELLWGACIPRCI